VVRHELQQWGEHVFSHVLIVDVYRLVVYHLSNGVLELLSSDCIFVVVFFVVYAVFAAKFFSYFAFLVRSGNSINSFVA
jgi:ABC-type uncharacterized transport system permease subunit